jgi:hypothetical protein
MESESSGGLKVLNPVIAIERDILKIHAIKIHLLRIKHAARVKQQLSYSVILMSEVISKLQYFSTISVEEVETKLSELSPYFIGIDNLLVSILDQFPLHIWMDTQLIQDLISLPIHPETSAVSIQSYSQYVYPKLRMLKMLYNDIHFVLGIHTPDIDKYQTHKVFVLSDDIQ